MDYMTFVDHLLRCCGKGGAYAVAVQSRIRRQPEKAAGNAFASALTDADLSIQNFFEVELLGAGYPIRFDPEEAERSLNIGYFPQDAEHTLLLDPVDGTKIYADCIPYFGIACTLLCKSTVVAGVYYMPHERRAYVMVEGLHGPRIINLRDPHQWLSLQLLPNGGQPLRFPRKSTIVVAWDQALDPAMMHRLREQCNTVAFTSYPGPNPKTWRYGVPSVLTGDAAAIVKPNAKLLDFGVAAWIVEHAGGCVSDFAGQPIPNYLDYPEQRIPGLVMSRDRATHDHVISALHGEDKGDSHHGSDQSTHE
ncbi:hypothetical protein HY632_03460 [Candidatus Uhrbacteria bacterium]|nr:hypothetical protein [Candidatus Uhrbacteria bacterium]